MQYRNAVPDPVFSSSSKRAEKASQRSAAQAREENTAFVRRSGPPGIKALQGQADILRLRIGDYRVIYQVNDENTLIRILKIGHRREIYRGL